MKKLLLFGAMVAMLLGTTGCKESFDEPNNGEVANVNLTIDLGGIESRAIADGLLATKLQIAVYKEDGTLLSDVSKLDANAVTMSGKQATVTFQLVKGVTYKFAFWAQNPNEDAYTFDATNAKIEVDYSKAVANADDGDAFYNYIERTITGPLDETIVLTRPFAQLNYGDIIADYNAAVAAGLDLSQTVVTVKQVAPTFNLATGSSEGTPVDVVWPAATSVINEDLAVEGTNYKWLSMCYFLVPNDEATIETELSMLNAAGTEFNKLTVDNVPVKKNHRTNILGNLFTETANFTIIIDENFDTPDYNLIGAQSLLDDAIQVEGATVELLSSARLTLDLSKVAKDVTIKGNGATIDIDKTGYIVTSDNVTIENVKISNKNAHGSANQALIHVDAPNFTLKDAEFVDRALYHDGVGYKQINEINIVGNYPAGVITLDNVKMEMIGCYRCVYGDYGSVRQKVEITNCTMDNATYPFNCGGAQFELVFKGCVMNGWSSWDNGADASFEDCTFGFYGYACIRPYSTTTFTNCVFSNKYKDGTSIGIAPNNSSKSTAVGCTYEDGTPLGVESLLANDTDCIGCEFTIDGNKYVYSSTNKVWELQ